MKPLLIISYRNTLTHTQAEAVNAALKRAIGGHGWESLVVDCMDEAKVQAFGLDMPAISQLSLDEVIDMLESLKRVKEQARK
jgi:hypothetical protein